MPVGNSIMFRSNVNVINIKHNKQVNHLDSKKLKSVGKHKPQSAKINNPESKNVFSKSSNM